MNARRTVVRLTFAGVDISADINKHLLSLTYTDNEEDKTDDLQLSLDDREGVWLGKWLNTPGASKGVEISALAYYPNTMDPDPEKRAAAIAHLEKVIDASAMLRVNMVTTFIGRDQNKTVEENMALFRQIWPGIIRKAEEKNVKVAIENCPMLFGPDQWPGGQNLFTSPVLWKEMFAIIDSPCFGINYDPSHFVWQMMDYIQPIYDFRDKIFHVHVKDIKLYKQKLAACGTMAYPLDYMSPKIPGLGDVDWSKYISALTDIGYDGYVCLEIEDRSFEKSQQDVLNSLILSKRYMEQFVI